VSDLSTSADFYTSVFGLGVVTKFHLPTMDEIILSMDGRGAALVLMCHTDGVARDLANTGGKIVFYVVDPVENHPDSPLKRPRVSLDELVRYDRWS